MINSKYSHARAAPPAAFAAAAGPGAAAAAAGGEARGRGAAPPGRLHPSRSPGPDARLPGRGAARQPALAGRAERLRGQATMLDHNMLHYTMHEIL